MKSNDPRSPRLDQGVHGLDRRGNTQVDFLRDSCSFPEFPGQPDPFVANIAGHDQAIAGQRQGYGGGAVAGEHPHFQGLAGSHQPHQHSHQRPLLRRDLHPGGGPGLGRRRRPQLPQNLGLAHPVAHQIIVDLGGQSQRFVRHTCRLSIRAGVGSAK